MVDYRTGVFLDVYFIYHFFPIFFTLKGNFSDTVTTLSKLKLCILIILMHLLFQIEIVHTHYAHAPLVSNCK